MPDSHEPEPSGSYASNDSASNDSASNDSASNDSASHYHVADGEDVRGPYKLAEMLELVTAGSARVDMLYSRDGADWVEGYDCPELFPDVSSGAPPPPAHREVRRRRRLQSHRGGAVLTLGIVGVVGSLMCAPVGICGIIAWVMAHKDLAKMRAGDMDPAGQSQTSAGRILGIIATILLILMIALIVFFVAFAPRSSRYTYG